MSGDHVEPKPLLKPQFSMNSREEILWSSVCLFLPTQKDKACIGKTIPPTPLPMALEFHYVLNQNFVFPLGHW